MKPPEENQMADFTLKLSDKYAAEVRQAISHRWANLEKRAKQNEQEGVTSDAREKMVLLEEVMRTMEPQIDLVDEINHPPERY
jgi:hypothetical protein